MKFKAPKNIIWAFVCFALLILLYKTVDNLDSVRSFFSSVLAILKPFFIGFVIAYILNIPCRKIQGLLERSKYTFLKKKSRTIGISCVYAAFVVLIVLFIRMIIPALYKNISDLYVNMPQYAKAVADFITRMELEEKISLLNIDAALITSKITQIISEIDLSRFGDYARGVVNVTSGVINIFLALVISVYMLIDKDRMKKSFKYVLSVFFGKDTIDVFSKNISTFNEILSKYISCQLLDACIVAVLSIIVMGIIRIKYALILGILIGVCNLIPYFGAIIAIAVTIFVTCFTDGILKAVWTLILLLVMQQIDANIIGPKIMGQSLELRPLMVIFAVTLGGGLFGVAGMILSVPVFAMIKLLAERYIEVRAARRSDTEEHINED